MTTATDTLRSTSLRAARAEAVVTWAYAGGFGIPAIPVGVYLDGCDDFRTLHTKEVFYA
jgi:hypothetical protein